MPLIMQQGAELTGCSDLDLCVEQQDEEEEEKAFL